MKRIGIVSRKASLAGSLFALLLVALLAFAAGAPVANAQTTLVTGTFKTPGNQTPAQANLKVLAAIAATSVYGSVDFVPFDTAGNQVREITCNGATYLPQNVRGWIKADGTLMAGDATAGVALVPNAGCSPTGLATRATIHFSASSDDRVPAVTLIQTKPVPQQSSVDWASLAPASIATPATAVQLSANASVSGYEEWSGLASPPVNPASGLFRTFLNTSTAKFSCITSTGADCNPASGGGGATLQTNTVNNTSQAVLNLLNSAATNGITLTETNTSAGNVQLGLSGVLTVPGGGTGAASVPGTNGQLIFNNNGAYGAEDPVVSQPTASLLNAQVVGNVASAASDSGNPIKVGGVFNTTQPTVTTGQRVDQQMSARGGHIVATGIDVFHVTVDSAPTTAVTGTFWQATQPVSGTFWQATQPVSIASMPSTAVTGTFWQATQPVSIAAAVDVSDRAARLAGQVEGRAASGAAKAGNPNQIGGVFNTTQPTVTTGQAVEAQMSARGAQIVATGVDAFHVTVDSAPTTAVTGTFWQATQPVSWSAQTVTATQGTGTNLHMVCDSGCSGSGGTSSTDNSAFTVGTSLGTPAYAYFTSGAAPALTTGNIGRMRMDANSYLFTDCVVGCSGGATTPSDAFANPTTAGLSFSFLAGFNGTTWDRLQVDASKFLKVNCATGCSGGATTPTDAFANPTTAGLGLSFLAGFNGTTWDRLRSTIANGLAVDVTRVQGSIAVTGTFWQTTQPVSIAAAVDVSDRAARLAGEVEGRAASGAAKAGNPNQIGGVFNTTQPTVTTGQAVEAQFTARGAAIVASGVDVFNVTVNAALPAGTNVIGHVIADSGSTMAVTGNVAVTKADASDVTLGAKADAKSTATDTTAITVMQVLKEISAMEQAPASRAVTNAGTFAVQATLAAETTKVIGTVNQGTSPWIVAGGGTAGTPGTAVLTIQGVASMTKLLVTPDSVALPANQSVNISQINAVTPLMGNGATGTGSPRVTVASDNTPFETVQVATASPTDTSLRCTIVSAASTNATNCKASAGNVYGYRFVNTTTTIYYLRTYNLTGAPTCSSATGFVESIPLPPAGAAGQAGGIVSIEPFGEGYSTGIGFCLTGGSASTDATNAAVGVFGTVLYK